MQTILAVMMAHNIRTVKIVLILATTCETFNMLLHGTFLLRNMEKAVTT